MTPVCLVVANPATSGNVIVNQDFSNSAYHGSIVWSWQLVAMARGFGIATGPLQPAVSHPNRTFAVMVYENLEGAYNTPWDSIEDNEEYISDEVWSWLYEGWIV